MPHVKNLPRLIVTGFQDEEKQNRTALEKINLEVLEIEHEIKIKTLEEKECRSDEQKTIEKQSELKREQSEVLKK